MGAGLEMARVKSLERLKADLTGCANDSNGVYCRKCQMYRWKRDEVFGCMRLLMKKAAAFLAAEDYAISIDLTASELKKPKSVFVKNEILPRVPDRLTDRVSDLPEDLPEENQEEMGFYKEG